MNSSTLKTHVAQSVAGARVGNWMSPLIIEPDQLFICQITWEETELNRTELNWSSLKMILRNSQFIFAGKRKAWVSFQYFYCLIEVWRGAAQMQMDSASDSDYDFVVLEPGVWFSTSSWSRGCGRHFGKEINCRSAAGFLKPESEFQCGRHAACHMTMMWHKLATREQRAGNCSGLRNLIVFAFATKSQRMRSSSIFTFTVSWV